LYLHALTFVFPPQKRFIFLRILRNASHSSYFCPLSCFALFYINFLWKIADTSEFCYRKIPRIFARYFVARKNAGGRIRTGEPLLEQITPSPFSFLYKKRERPWVLWNCYAIPYVPRKNVRYFSVGLREKNDRLSVSLGRLPVGNLPFFFFSARRFSFSTTERKAFRMFLGKMQSIFPSDDKKKKRAVLSLSLLTRLGYPRTSRFFQRKKICERKEKMKFFPCRE